MTSLTLFGVVCDYVETNPNRSEAEFTEGKFNPYNDRDPGLRKRPVRAKSLTYRGLSVSITPNRLEENLLGGSWYRLARMSRFFPAFSPDGADVLSLPHPP
ncbi:hypothetical protein TBC1_11461 [Lentimicrobium saccharophilum]|uniref:Uncharacterized protein n=1 Tax=Lentimicrobium saccharophilum TaxID=1678841 RepID=A0A0S7BPL0_9BACT|nr:hypothetical protein TBC1_11461 [Lentimicrobium saccharophilum]